MQVIAGCRNNKFVKKFTMEQTEWTGKNVGLGKIQNHLPVAFGYHIHVYRVHATFLFKFLARIHKASTASA